MRIIEKLTGEHGGGGGGGRQKLFKLLESERSSLESSHDNMPTSTIGDGNPSPGWYPVDGRHGTSPEYETSPCNLAATSPYLKSPWTHASPVNPFPGDPTTGLLGSLVRQVGHVYSLAAAGELLYTGSDSKNIRVWKGAKEFSGFKSNSGLVKAIVVSGDGRRVYTGHQDGKIRVWKVSSRNPMIHRRAGTLPSFKDFVKSSINPKSYVRVRRNRNVIWLRHFDAVSCMSMDEKRGLLYSGSWDMTFKVWRLSDYKCLLSVVAHDDAINAVAVVPPPANLLLTGSADGTLKAWEITAAESYDSKHELVDVLFRREAAVTALAVGRGGTHVYAGSSDGCIDLWDVEGAGLVHRGAFRGHRMAVLCLATAGGLLLSGSADKTIRVWRRAVGGGAPHERVALLAEHEGPVKCLAVEEERRSEEEGVATWVVYSGSLDRTVKVWRLLEGEGVNGAAMALPPTPPHSTE